ncbi:Nonribosomal peptide synthetase-like protein [Emericellopsis cladophorae]|uniref:Nonribosomal peptide synthetase-like protein n=1 Tax=Emericellopsis cladophorae TaxID=2686198 RepID=A0A9P9XZ79_9HYPO|nr:Nonribosomal peptide synthetase-like protein [Emericellopsis cladophorae]KAI6780628.1 Nonribosomal peptide synthetase-like protein [Emericellopsis cladophorae]
MSATGEPPQPPGPANPSAPPAAPMSANERDDVSMLSPGDTLVSDESTTDQYHKFIEQEDLEVVVPRQLYEKLDTVGMNYGPLFRNIVELRKNANSCASVIQIPDTQSKMPANFEYTHLIHPATLDSMVQTLFAIDSVPMVPTFIESIFVSANLDNDMGTHFKGVSTVQRLGVGNAKADITMSLDGISSLQVVIKGLHLTALEDTTLATESIIPNHHNLCTEIIWKEDATFAQAQTLGEWLELLSHKHPALEILQIGGSIAKTLDILESVAGESMPVPTLARYSIVDSNSGTSQSLQRILEGTRLQPYVEYISLDEIATDQKYHMVIVSALPDSDPMQYQKLVRPGGWVVGTLVGSQQNSLLDHSAVMTRIPGEYLATAPVELVVLHRNGREQHARSLVEGLSKCQGEFDYDYRVSSMSLAKAMKNCAVLAHKVVVSLLDLHTQTELTGFVTIWNEPEFDFFQRMHAAAKGVIWITRGANRDPQDPLMASVMGLARTLMSEDPRKLFVTLDLGIETSLSDGNIAAMLLTIFLMTFCEIGDDQHMEPKEMEFSEADGKLYIPRLIPVQSLNQIIENGATDEIVPSLAGPGKGVKVEMVKVGTSRDSMQLSEYEVKAPQPHEVQIQFEQAELNYRDVEIALGQSTSSDLGRDLRGTITNKGSDVGHHKIGDKVVALVTNGSLKTLVNVDARFVLSDLTGFTASTSLTVFYALCHVGKLEIPGRSMSLSTPNNRSALITGGVGYCQPAFALCQMLGVKVFFAIANEDAHKYEEALQRIGVDAVQILKAGSMELSEILKQRNNGKGVDVVLHASPTSIESTAACIKPGGAIVHVQHQTTGRRPTLVKLLTNITYVRFDLESLLREAPDFVANLLPDIYHAMASCGEIVYEENRTFEMTDTADALKQLRESPSLDSVTISLGSEPTSGSNDQSRVKGKTLKEMIDPKSTYLLSGGLGGLGRSIATLLVDNGARFLVFLSREGAVTSVTQDFVAHLRRRRVRVRVYPVFISDMKDMMDLFKSRISWEMPPVKGIFQCSGGIRDAMFETMNLDNWIMAFVPKASGSKCLVDAAYAANYDPFFVFLASAAGVVGNRGQANYAAGNCVQDALARNLRLKGKNAVAIDLGPILGAGMLANDENLLNKLLANGFYGVSHDHFLQVVKHAITMETLPGVPMPPQVTLGIGTGGLILQNKPADPYWSRTAMYNYLNLVDMPPPNLEGGHSTTSNMDIKSLLRQNLDISVATEVICTGLMHMLAKSMNMLFEEMDSEKQPSAYGVDSLVAVGVRNWVYTNCNTTSSP